MGRTGPRRSVALHGALLAGLAFGVRSDLPLRGRLVDARTGEPVPAFAIEVERSGLETLRLCTDEHGRFSTGVPLEPGRVSLVLVDDERSPRAQRGGRVRTTHAGEGAERDLPLEVGPTFELALTAPSELAAPPVLEAWLFHDPPRGPETGGARAPVREADGRAFESTWVRFRDASAEERFSGAPWWLEVRDEAGHLAGGARGASVLGAAHPGVSVALEARARVTALTPEPGLRFVLEALQGPDGTAVPLVSDEAGVLFAKWLPPGRWRLSASDARFERASFEFELAPLDTLELGALDVAPRVLSARLEVELRSRRGDFEDDLLLEVHELARPDLPARIVPELDADESGSDSRVLARFVLDDLAAGPLRFVVRLGAHGPSVPLECGARAGDRDADAFTCTVDDRVEDRELWLLSAEDGEPLTAGEVQWRLGESREWFPVRGAGRVPMRELPIGEWAHGAELLVRAPGRAMTRVAWSDVLEGHPEEPTTVALARGWAQEVRAHDRRTSAPLAGVLVRLDGEPAGETDARGIAWVTRPEPPRRLVAERAGYVQVGADPKWLAEALAESSEFGIDVWLAPNSN